MRTCLRQRGGQSRATREATRAEAAADAASGKTVTMQQVIFGCCKWRHRDANDVVPILVLNKIDRLVCELQLSPLEAWQHLKHVVQQVNAIAGHLYKSAVMEAESLLLALELA